MTKNLSIDNYENVLGALKLAIDTVEKRVNRIIGAPKIIKKDGTIDLGLELNLAKDLDDLCAARLVYKKLVEQGAGSAPKSADGSLLADEWKKWFAVLLWDGVRTEATDAHSHRYLDDSLRSLLCDHMSRRRPGAMPKTPADRINLLQASFSIASQENVKGEFFKEREQEILRHQQQSLERLETAITELRAYVGTLPANGEKALSATSLIERLSSRKTAYLRKLEEFNGKASDFNQRSVFFRENQRFVNDSIQAIRQAKLEAHRDGNLKIILTNLLIALTGVGLLVLIARSLYASFNPSTPHLFASKTRGREWADRAEKTLAELEDVKNVVMTTNPLYKRAP